MQWRHVGVGHLTRKSDFCYGLFLCSRRKSESDCETEMYTRLDSETSTGKNGSKTEAFKFTSTAISDSYGSTPAVHDRLVARFSLPWCGLVFYVMAFFGFFCALLVRECLSVAIVVMVNQTVDVDHMAVANFSEDQCSRDPELRHDGGEFNWDRHQQGILLAAFYYGYGLLQVRIANIVFRFQRQK